MMLHPGNDDLKEYLYLKSTIKTLTKRMNEIGEACKEFGSFCTANYVCAVKEQTRTHLAGLDEVKKFFSEETLKTHGLIKVATFKLLDVAPMPEILVPTLTLEELEDLLKKHIEANP